MSRWTRPRAWAASSAAATWATIATARSGSAGAPLDQQAAQVGAVDQVHRHEQQPVLLAGVVDRDDVRVAERDGDPRLASGSARGSASSPARSRRDHLQGDDVVERQVGRPVDDTHAAAAGDRPRCDGRRRWIPGSGRAWRDYTPARPRPATGRLRRERRRPTISASRSSVCWRSPGSGWTGETIRRSTPAS